MTHARGQRVVLIGLDSVEIDYLEPRLGTLPHLGRFFAGAVVRRLDSPAHVMSASVWPTFYTGTPPGEHGQYFPMQWDAERMRLRHVAADWIDCEPFWRPLARRGLAVTTLDVQNAFPCRTPDGVEVVNWGVNAFGGFHCNRPEIGQEIVHRFGRDPMRFDTPVDKSPDRLAIMRRRLLASARQRGALARWLMHETEWQLFAAVFPECHRAGHYFWPAANGDRDDSAGDAADALGEVHRAVDDEVGRLMEGVDLAETTVIVFSLLGMESNRSQMHFVPAVLDRVNAAFAGALGSPPPAPRSLLRTLRQVLPAGLQERIALAVPEPVRDWVIARTFTAGLDWSRAPGFALPTGGEGYVRANLAGRETTGCLPRGGDLHRRYLAAVEEGFRSLRDATSGESLVGDVHRPTEEFPGPRRDGLPDIAITWGASRPATEVRSERLGSFSGRLATGRSGNHRAAAFAAVAGPARSSPRAAALGSVIDLSRFVQDLVTAAQP